MTRSTDVLFNKNTAQTINTTSPVNLSVGSGIALVGIWLVSAALTVFLALFGFTDLFSIAAPPTPADSSQTDAGMAVLIMMLLVALPCISAYKLTKLIIGVDKR